MESSAVGEGSSGSPAVALNGTAASPSVNVWMVDNQVLFQEAVAVALAHTSDLVLGASYVHPEDALSFDSRTTPPDVILMDIHQFGCAGLPAVRQFRTAFPRVSLIVLTELVEPDAIANAICAGASGYLLKDSALENIPEFIRDVVSGGASLSSHVAHSVLEMFRRLSGARYVSGLTARELRILDLMGQGLVMKEIAEQLTISYHTVDTHSRHIYAKLKVHSRTEAVAKALRERII